MARARTTRVDQLAVAYLTSEGRTQTQIAATLGLKQSAVSRLLSKAVGYLDEQKRYRFREDLLAPGELDVILRRVSHKQLGDRLDEVARANGHVRGPVVRVVSSASTDLSADPATRFMSFTSQAAPYVRSLLVREAVQTCGITWGYMLWDLSIALRSLPGQRPWRAARRPIRFTPLSGDPIQNRKDQPPNLTSSNIAAELGRIANADDYRSPWLGLVPAYIPEEFKKRSEVNVIERMIHMVSEYEEIFGSKNKAGIADHLDMILTSVGTAESPLGFGRGRLLAGLGKRLEDLKRQIYGDIGGVLLLRNPSKKSALVKGIELRWKGLVNSHLERCALRAFQEDPLTGRPGVVVLSIGADRAEVIYHAVSRGLINHLVIDQELEKALEALVASAAK